MSTDHQQARLFLIWDGALRARPCSPAVLSAQLERLVSRLRPGNVRIGILPFEADMNVPAGVGFSIHDDELVITETWHAEMWLDDPADRLSYLPGRSAAASARPTLTTRS